MSTKVA